MDDQQHMRASDHDRQEVVDRLGAALQDGRLNMEEYVDRMGLAYQAVTYGDLALLGTDLAAAGPVATREPAAGGPRPDPCRPGRPDPAFQRGRSRPWGRDPVLPAG
jgi:hypothetical protein